MLTHHLVGATVVRLNQLTIIGRLAVMQYSIDTSFYY
jgi:hypothetical protein